MWNYYALLCTISVLTIISTAYDLVPGNWDGCKKGSQPPTQVNTTSRISELRGKMSLQSISAYLVPNEDAHQSEYPSEHDKRRGYISGFHGSAGYAVVTMNASALWTDGRYFLEAEDTLDCNWILMRAGEAGVPTMTEWLSTQLNKGQILGANPYLVGSSIWKSYSEALAKFGIDIQKTDDLIDQIWNASNGRANQPNTPLNALPLQFSGIPWENKVNDMRIQMEKNGIDMLVVTALDETAWLFNMRATDIEFNPFFLSYAIVENSTVTLYILEHLKKLKVIDETSNTTIANHLNTNEDGNCINRNGSCVHVKDYGWITNDTRDKSANARKIWLGYSCNQAIYSAVTNTSNIYQANTPIATAKTKKNQAEVEGMKKAHIRDATALIAFVAHLDNQVKAGEHWTELRASDALEKYRLNQTYNKGLSFNTISASGSNGAIIHYSASNATDKIITTSEMYLLDSGGQYLDGTTDVTRTFHFGNPKAYEKECYTRVLMGHIDLFLAKWPRGLYGRDIDAFARSSLWDVGLVYRHGTGHGIGMFLSVHEGPGRISHSTSEYARDQILDENQFFSDEPGYYEAGEFGIRIENIVMIKNASTKYKVDGTSFLTFEYVTLVPYEPNLILYDMLSETQIQYLNDYNKVIREKVGPELLKQGYHDGYKWLVEKTNQYSNSKGSTSGSASFGLSTFCVLCFVISITRV